MGDGSNQVVEKTVEKELNIWDFSDKLLLFNSYLLVLSFLIDLILFLF